jgi:hypothetical protein
VATVERGDRRNPSSFSSGYDGGVHAAERQVVVARDEPAIRIKSAGWTGSVVIASDLDAAAAESRRERQRRALARAGELIDAEMLLGDSAWR